MTKEIGGGDPTPEILDHDMVVGAVTTAPVKGTIVTDVCKYWRWKQFLFMRWDYLQSSGGSSGLGTLLFPIPADLTIDVALMGINNAEPTMAVVGDFRSEAGSIKWVGNVHVYDETRLYASGMNATTEATIRNPSNLAFSASDLSISMLAQWIPIVEWR